jgi:hypothetical protein
MAAVTPDFDPRHVSQGLDVKALREFEKALQTSGAAATPGKRVTQAGLPADALPCVIDPRVRAL